MTALAPIRRCVRRLARDRRGSAAVEFALLMPALLALSTLVVEGGRLIWHHEAITKGVREAIRYLSRVDDPTDLDAQARAINLAMRGQLSGGRLRLGSWTDAATIQPSVTTIDNSDGAFRGPSTIRVVTVTATVAIDYPMAQTLRLFDPSLPTRLTIRVADTARHYGE